MPWQSAPAIAIIGGMFAAIGVLVNGVDYVAGKVKRTRSEKLVVLVAAIRGL